MVDCTGGLAAKAHAIFEEQALCYQRKKPAIRKIQSIGAFLEENIYRSIRLMRIQEREWLRF